MTSLICAKFLMLSILCTVTNQLNLMYLLLATRLPAKWPSQLCLPTPSQLSRHTNHKVVEHQVQHVESRRIRDGYEARVITDSVRAQPKVGRPLMVGTIHTDNEDELHVVARPVRKTKPTAALLQHSEKAALPSQTKAINDFRVAEAAKLATERQLVAADQTEISPAPKNSKRIWSEGIFDTDIENSDDEHENARTNPKQKRVRQATVTEDRDDDRDDDRENARTNPK
ncbi:hypothetical protein DFH29DRAFT_884153, partial [Suillus ampliporus]